MRQQDAYRQMQGVQLKLHAIPAPFSTATSPSLIVCLYLAYSKLLQELRYRQQIARQLRTQYAEGIYRLKYYTVALKSRLRVAQGHWKRNHWIDHTRLSSGRVI